MTCQLPMNRGIASHGFKASTDLFPIPERFEFVWFPVRFTVPMRDQMLEVVALHEPRCGGHTASRGGGASSPAQVVWHNPGHVTQRGGGSGRQDAKPPRQAGCLPLHGELGATKQNKSSVEPLHSTMGSALDLSSQGGHCFGGYDPVCHRSLVPGLKHDSEDEGGDRTSSPFLGVRKTKMKSPVPVQEN